jgi:enoyl-CoA hydratase
VQEQSSAASERDSVKKELETLIYTVEDGIAVIRLNRPDRMNSIGGSMKQDLGTAFLDYARNDPSVRCLVVTGTGDRAFCAGADIKERAASTPPPADYYVHQQLTHDLFRSMEEFERPVIAAINGVALGGGLEIALCCDLRIAASTARLGLPEIKLGAIPAAGGTQRLPRLVGEAIAKELIYTSELISAERALAIGLVNRVVEPAELMPVTMALARKIAEQPPLAVAFAKRAVNAGMQVGIDSGLELERFAMSMLIDTEDRKEGMRAFVEKRRPVFRGV